MARRTTACTIAILAAGMFIVCISSQELGDNFGSADNIVPEPLVAEIQQDGQPSWRLQRQKVWAQDEMLLATEDKGMHTGLHRDMEEQESPVWDRYMRYKGIHEPSPEGHSWEVEGKGTVRGSLMQTSAGEKGRICDTKVNQHHGYFNLKGASKKSYFYWMFEAHNKPETAPLVMWLTGGPGCSSEIALFTENGPCSVNKNGRTTSANKHSWNKDVNMLYIDQPAGTGFSYGETDTSEAQVSSDLSHFMQEFVKKYPKFHNNDFYIFGESYAGHFVPATAHKIMSMNHARNSGEYIALKGAAIGNGQTNPLEQYKYYAEMARHPSHGPHAEDIPPAISEGTYEDMKAAQPGCIRLIKGCQTHTSYCSEAFSTCNSALLAPVQQTGVNVYNMKKQCGKHALCADYSHVTKFLNSDKVTNVLKTHKKWSTCNMNINSMFSTDWMKNMAVHIPPMLHNGNRIMIYAGDLDFICNWRGNKAWTLQMPWNGHKGFNNAKDREWHLDGQSKASRLLQEGAQSESKSSPVGFERRYQNLQFVRIRNAGHMVPGDQPEVAQAMMQRFVAKKFLVYPEDSASDY